jgi:glycosyltransferase involved in cell wall biosynthesis
MWIGDGELKHLLASPNIKITGWLPKRSVIDALKVSQIYLSTALWEGLPFSVLEAMDCHLCLVLSQCVGNEDLVREDENGHLFKEWQSAIAFINKLIAEPFLINRLGHNSYDRLTNEFSAEDMVLKYKLLYQQKSTDKY